MVYVFRYQELADPEGYLLSPVRLLSPRHWTYAFHPYHKTKSGKARWFGVLVSCPVGHETHLVPTSYIFEDDGIVIPEVRCEYSGCTFHGPIKLHEWDPKVPLQSA
jgi:hypothetical protein